ncbi:MAG: sulfatase-like hydrolase/transferase [Planctomycetes bacterium]|nr:sulfatase-like hydrolase/transferase [Planctomycetota bacterium]
MRSLLRTLLLCASVPALAHAQQPTNTLLVIADDVGIDLIGSYGVGSDPAPTPTLDALAARGVRFERAYACPTCSPTRAAILTGRYGLRTGVGAALAANEGGLARSEVLLPELLGTRGVASALIGKWHLGDEDGALTPTLDGFGTFVGSLQGAVQDYQRWAKVENGRSRLETSYATTVLVDALLQATAGASQPWFAVLAFQAAHSPWHEPPAHLHTQDLTGLDPQRDPRAFTKAMLQALDTELGRLFAQMDPLELARTNVIVIGDNGSAPTVASAPFDTAHAKGTLYEGGVRVPLLAAGPSVARRGAVERAPVHAVDLFATIAALHGVDARASVPAAVELDSLSFAPLLSTAGSAARAQVYTEQFTSTPWTRASGDGEAVIESDWKLLRRVARSGAVLEELYELAVDPYEQNELLRAPLAPDATEAYLRLRGALARLRGEAWVASYGSGCPASTAPILVATTRPLLGAAFAGELLGSSPALAAFLWMGFDRFAWRGVPLPLALDGIALPGCALLTGPELAWSLLLQASVASWSFALPNDAALLGFEVELQGALVDPTANAGGLALSAALKACVGER